MPPKKKAVPKASAAKKQAKPRRGKRRAYSDTDDDSAVSDSSSASAVAHDSDTATRVVVNDDDSESSSSSLSPARVLGVDRRRQPAARRAPRGEDEAGALPTASKSESAAQPSAIPVAPSASEPVVKRPRGRPPGSTNKKPVATAASPPPVLSISSILQQAATKAVTSANAKKALDIVGDTVAPPAAAPESAAAVGTKSRGRCAAAAEKKPAVPVKLVPAVPATSTTGGEKGDKGKKKATQQAGTAASSTVAAIPPAAVTTTPARPAAFNFFAPKSAAATAGSGAASNASPTGGPTTDHSGSPIDVDGTSPTQQPSTSMNSKSLFSPSTVASLFPSGGAANVAVPSAAAAFVPRPTGGIQRLNQQTLAIASLLKSITPQPSSSEMKDATASTVTNGFFSPTLMDSSEANDDNVPTITSSTSSFVPYHEEAVAASFHRLLDLNHQQQRDGRDHSGGPTADVATQDPAALQYSVSDASPSSVQEIQLIDDAIFDDDDVAVVTRSGATATTTVQPTQPGAQMLVEAWRAVDATRPLSELPQLPDAFAYAQSYLEAAIQIVEQQKNAGQPWSQRHAFPAFPGSDCERTLVQFTDWVLSWKDSSSSNNDASHTAAASADAAVATTSTTTDSGRGKRATNGKRTGNRNGAASSDSDGDDGNAMLQAPAAVSRRVMTPPRPLHRQQHTRIASPGHSGPTYDADGIRVSRRLRDQFEREQREHESSMANAKGYFKGTSPSKGHFLLRRRLSTTTNIAVISGPSGVGKTALVLEIAARTNCRVIDVNTGVHRSGANLMKLFSESTKAKVGVQVEDGAQTLMRTQNALAKSEQAAAIAAAAKQQIMDEAEKKRKAEEEAKAAAEAAKAKASAKRGTLTKQALQAFFAPKPKKQPKAANNNESTACLMTDDAVVHEVQVVDDQPPPPCPAPTVSNSSVTTPPPPPPVVQTPLLFVDSGDVTFADEVGFTAAIRNIANESKCPVIVTVNRHLRSDELQAWYGSEDVPQRRIGEPPKYLVLFYLLAVTRAECLSLPSSRKGDASVPPPPPLPTAVELLEFINARPGRRSSDPRALLGDLQWFMSARAAAKDTPPANSSRASPTSKTHCCAVPAVAAVDSLIPMATAVNRHRGHVRQALARAQIAQYFGHVAHQVAIDPIANGDPDDDSNACAPAKQLGGEASASSSSLLAFLEAEWHRRDVSALEADWHTGRDIVWPDRTTQLQIGFGEPRERFEDGAASLGLGDVQERGLLYQRLAARFPKRTQKMALHATESAEAMADLLLIAKLPNFVV